MVINSMASLAWFFRTFNLYIDKSRQFLVLWTKSWIKYSGPGKNYYTCSGSLEYLVFRILTIYIYDIVAPVKSIILALEVWNTSYSSLCFDIFLKLCSFAKLNERSFYLLQNWKYMDWCCSCAPTKVKLYLLKSTSLCIK